jgi:hypothetical protein
MTYRTDRDYGPDYDYDRWGYGRGYYDRDYDYNRRGYRRGYYGRESDYDRWTSARTASWRGSNHGQP